MYMYMCVYIYIYIYFSTDLYCHPVLARLTGSRGDGQGGREVATPNLPTNIVPTTTLWKRKADSFLRVLALQ